MYEGILTDSSSATLKEEQVLYS